MEVQLVRFTERRKERHREKKEAILRRQSDKDRLYLENTHKIGRLKREIDDMYVELEHQYNNHGLIELENQLDQDRRELQSRFDESKAMYQLRKG